MPSAEKPVQDAALHLRGTWEVEEKMPCQDTAI